MSTLERAIVVAARAHEGQYDKGGAAYILHPLRVMMRVSTPEQRIVAVLHDVLEDTQLTVADLAREGFPLKILAALLSLSRRRGRATRHSWCAWVMIHWPERSSWPTLPTIAISPALRVQGLLTWPG